MYLFKSEIKISHRLVFASHSIDMAGFERWVDKVAIVTGASSGIGAAIAERLVKEGLKVVGLARRSENVQKEADKLVGEKGKLYAFKCDVSKEDELLKAFKWTSDNVGPVHILVNNAGIIRDTNIIEGETQKWKDVFDVNVIGLLVATREAVKIMRENKIDGHIIHINSVAGHYDLYGPKINVYPASKHAVTNLTETLRKEFNANNLKIKVTSVSPGLVDTEIIRNVPEIVATIDQVPILQSEDIADAVYYALSTKPHVQVHEIMVRPVSENF